MLLILIMDGGFFERRDMECDVEVRQIRWGSSDWYVEGSVL